MICRRCVLSERVPRVILEKGLCQYCREIGDARKRAVQERAEALGMFRHYLAQTKRSQTSHDILMAYSGGKDSTYALELLVRRFRLRALAFTLDNGFMTEEVRRNIAVVTARLGVDHLYFCPEPSVLKKVLARSLEHNPHPDKSIERASPACISCIGIVKYSAYRLALEKQIPLIGFGWTPGQAPVSRAFLALAPPLVRAMEAPLKAAIEGVAGRTLDGWFMPAATGPESDFPALVHPTAFFNYDETRIYARLARLEWRRPRGLDPNSSNCRLNTLNVADHLKRYGFHPYAHELAALVRQGYLGRAEALRRLRSVPAARAARLRAELRKAG